MARIVDEGAEAGDLTFFSSVGNSPINTTNYTHIGGRAFQFDLNESGTTTLPSTTSIGSVSATEIGYVNDVTSSIQGQLNAKAPQTAVDTLTGDNELTYKLGLKLNKAE